MFEMRILSYLTIAFALYFVTVTGQYAFVEDKTERFIPGKVDKNYDTSPKLPWDKVKFSIFGPQEIESEKVEEDSTIVDDMAKESMGALLGAIPVVGSVAQLFLSLLFKLADESEWKNKFKENILTEVDQKSAKDEISKLVALIEAIHQSLSNAGDVSPETIAWDTRKDLDYMMNIFDAHKSIFKRYPLLGAPILIELANFISKFDRIINDQEISCKMRNILYEYSKRTVIARLDKISLEYFPLPQRGSVDNSKYDLPLIRSHTIDLPFENFYNRAEDWSCDFEYAVHKDTLDIYKLMQSHFKEMLRVGPVSLKVEPDHFKQYMLQDEFGRTYSFPLQLTDHQDPSFYCISEYFGEVRHRVEKQFPIEDFDKFCTEKSQKPSGLGYLTMQIKSMMGSDNSDKNPFKSKDSKLLHAKIFINGNLVDTKNMDDPCVNCFFNQTYDSKMINKNSTIEIEVLKGDKVVLTREETKNTIEYYLNHAAHYGQKNDWGLTRLIEIYSIWKDEYEASPIDDIFVAKKRGKTHKQLTLKQTIRSQMCRFGPWRPEDTTDSKIRKMCDHIKKIQN